MANLFENNGDKLNGAKFNNDRSHRLSLWRIWDPTKPLVMFIGLNPSTANEADPDRTISTVKAISKHNGYGGFYMMNLFTIISSDPGILDTQTSWGDFLREKALLIEYFQKCKSVVFAWGNFKQAQGRGHEVIREFKYHNPLCIKKNKNGSPVHPLYQKFESTLINF